MLSYLAAALPILLVSTSATATVLPRSQSILGAGGDGRAQVNWGGSDSGKGESLVPVTLGVMSQCPDAQVCENVFDKVLSKVGNKVDLQMVYIGQIEPKSEPYGVTCKHGPLECSGNVQQLCVQRLLTQSEHWTFVQCQNYGSTSEIGDEDLARRCVGVVGRDWDADGIGKCVEGDRGARLLRESVRLAEHLGITRSCTIQISGQTVCIHDGTWKECENGHDVQDFVDQINDEYRRLN